MSRWLIDGVAGDSISVMDRGLTYGDGLFETIAVRDGCARFLDYHLQRLVESCQRLSIAGPDTDALRTEVDDLAGGCKTGTIKIIVTRGIGERGYAPPPDPGPTRIVGLIPEEPPSPDSWRTGIEVKFCRTRIGIDPDVAGMKTLGRLDQVLARAELTDAGIREGLMCTEDGQVICGTMSNLFMVKGGELSTPDLTRCGIKGVMRRLVLEQARTIGIDARAAAITAEDLLGASEIFVTNTRIGIWPVNRVESTDYDIGPVTRHLMAALAGIGVVECAS